MFPTGCYRGDVRLCTHVWHHQPTVFKKTQSLHVCPVAVARRHRPGIVTRTAIVAVIAALAGFLTLVLSGVAQL